MYQCPFTTCNSIMIPDHGTHVGTVWDTCKCALEYSTERADCGNALLTVTKCRCPCAACRDNTYTIAWYMQIICTSILYHWY